MVGETVTESDAACRALLAAESEGDVEELLQQPFFDSNEWKPLGGIENNYGVVENQQGNAIAAIAEIIINSIDAILLKNYHLEHPNGTDPAYTTMATAAARLVTATDENITLTADGEGDHVNMTISDTGCGQPPQYFETRFLGFLEPGKLKREYDFLQGEYGMGSTGVLPYCGDHGYKLIVSAAHDQPTMWSWTLIRKNRAENSYQYFVKHGVPPSFTGAVGGQEFGTYVKLFNYQLTPTSHIGYGFRRYIDRYLLETPVPLRLVEERPDKKSAVSDFSTRGLLENLGRRPELVLKDYTIRHDFGQSDSDPEDILGTRDIRVVMFKDDDALTETEQDAKATYFVGGPKHRRQAIFLTINGQTHGDFGLTFIKNRCNRPRIAKDTLVFLDFTDLGPSEKVDIFPASRDRIRDDKALAQAVIEGLEDALKNDEILKAEEERRRQKVVKEEQDETVKEVLQQILSRNPQLKRYFASGEKAPIADIGPRETTTYNPPFIPDTFRIIERLSRTEGPIFWDEDATEALYRTSVPINRTRYQRFELNAPDDYFTRDRKQGDLIATPPDLVKSYALNDGLLTVRLAPANLRNATPSKVVTVTLAITRPGQDSLEQRFEVEIGTPVEQVPQNGSAFDPPHAALDLPETYRVWEDDWDEFDFDPNSVVEINHGDGELVLWINMDCNPLQNYLSRNNVKDDAKEYVLDMFELSVTLLASTQLIELDSRGYDDPPAEDIVATSMMGISQTLLDLVISEEKLDQITF